MRMGTNRNGKGEGKAGKGRDDRYSVTCCVEETRACAAKSGLGWTRRVGSSSSAGSGSPSTAAHGLPPFRGLAAAATASASRCPVEPITGPRLPRRRGNRDDDEGGSGRRVGVGAGKSGGVVAGRAHPLLVVVVAYICWAMTRVAASRAPAA
jgi:hypothetical protein